MSNTKNRGFASMDKEQQRALASKGGKAVSKNADHMSRIGELGGKRSGEVRRAKRNEPK